MQGSSRIQIVLIAVLAMSVSGCWAWKCGKNYSLGAELERSVGDPMVFVETFVEHKRSHERYPSHPGTFKEELIYTGRTGTTIGVTYREYSADFVRPAFFQDLKYDLSSSDVIVFRKWRLKVLEANNLEIRFRVLDDMGDCSPQPQ